MNVGCLSCWTIAGAVLVSAGAAPATVVALQTAAPTWANDVDSSHVDGRAETVNALAVCNLVDTVMLSDPLGDATPGAPLYVDIVAVSIHYLADRLQIEWVTADSSFGGEDILFADGQALRIAFDLDRNDSTGDNRSIPGVDFEVSVGGYPGEADLNYFDEQGNWLSEDLAWVPVEFTPTGFVLELDVEAHMFGSRHFDVAANTNGLNEWQDSVTLDDVVLADSDTSVTVRLRAEQMVLEAQPPLAAIPTTTSDLQLSSELLYNGSVVPVDPSLVSYEVTHSRLDFVPDPSSVISVTPSGLARYESDGFVFVRSRVECGAMHLRSEPLLLATGTVFGDPQQDSVIAVFRTDYTPDGSSVSFGDMMTGFPDAMRVFNIQYEVTRELYDGYVPLEADRQILSPIVADGLCGGPGNPLQTAPCCYMNCLDASPHYFLIHHEMGHNFQEFEGMTQLLLEKDGVLSNSGFGECSASLPIIYLQEEVLENGAAYHIEPGSYEHLYFESYRDQACADSPVTLQDFEQQIAAGAISGIFDPSLTTGVGVYCAFFEQFSCGYVDGPNPYRHDSVRRFLNLFGDRRLAGFDAAKVETYFGAAYSMAVGRDMRGKLRFWGFPIDDVYYQAIMPLLQLRLEQAETRILHDSFESGRPDQWLVGGGKDVRLRRGVAVPGGFFDLAIDVAPCATASELSLRDHTVSDLETFEACSSIAGGGDFVIENGGEAILTAGDSIAFESDFRVEAGGKLTAVIEPSLNPFAFIQSDSPMAEVTYNVEFQMNLDGLYIAAGDDIKHFVAYDGSIPVLMLVLGSGPQMSLAVKEDDGLWQSTTGAVLASGWNKVTINWVAGLNVSASLTLNDGTPLEILDLETSSRKIDFVRWGAVAGTVSGTSGTIVLDDFASWR